jgi:hypothetical protein
MKIALIIKNIILISFIMMFVSGCSDLPSPMYTIPKVQKVDKYLIAQLNMVSTRNVDMGNSNYELLRRYAGGSDRELAESRATSIRDAVEQTIKSVLGGEFLTNVKIYEIPHVVGIIEQETQLYYAAEGDVWGFKSNASEHYGFVVGDEVIWTEYSVSGNSKRQASGIIKSLINNRECLVEKRDGSRYTINYDLLIKVEQQRTKK